MAILKDYYLNSLSELKVDSYMYRTEGSSQVIFWHDNEIQLPEKKFINYRKYFSGMYKDSRFFAKQFLRPNKPEWSIRQSVEYQFMNLLLLKDLDYIPNPLFLTEDTIGMEYVKGETIKSLWLANKFTPDTADLIIYQLKNKGQKLIDRLKSAGRDYDISYNNLLLMENGQVVFIDFDFSVITYDISILIKTIEELKTGETLFDKEGNLYRKSDSLMNRIKRYMKQALNI